jgi:hypothetical protein
LCRDADRGSCKNPAFSSDQQNLEIYGELGRETSSVYFAPPASGYDCGDGSRNGAYLYKSQNYGGDCLFLDANVSDLNHVPGGFNDQVRSLKVRGISYVQLCKDADRGSCKNPAFNSDQSNLEIYGELGRETSSVYFNPPPSPYDCGNQTATGAYLFKSADYGGDCLFLTSDVSDLSHLPGDFNDQVRSLRLRNISYVQLCKDADRGTCHNPAFSTDQPNLEIHGDLGRESSSVYFAPPPACTDIAELDSQSDYPTVLPGETTHIVIRVRNAGTCTWNGPDYTYESTDGWAPVWGTGPLWRAVPPGDVIVFEDANVVAPDEPGAYNYGFLLKRNGSIFGPYFFIQVTVQEPFTPTPTKTLIPTDTPSATFTPTNTATPTATATPSGPDTDGDGYSDAQEIALGESPNSYCAIMRADVNYDTEVNSGDLLRVAIDFGNGSGRTDQNGDGEINSGDLLQVAFKFGMSVEECP